MPMQEDGAPQADQGSAKQVNCGCLCHRLPGVKHVASCCDAPPREEPKQVNDHRHTDAAIESLYEDPDNLRDHIHNAHPDILANRQIQLGVSLHEKMQRWHVEAHEEDVHPPEDLELCRLCGSRIRWDLQSGWQLWSTLPGQQDGYLPHAHEPASVLIPRDAHPFEALGLGVMYHLSMMHPGIESLTNLPYVTGVNFGELHQLLHRNDKPPVELTVVEHVKAATLPPLTADDVSRAFGFEPAVSRAEAERIKESFRSLSAGHKEMVDHPDHYGGRDDPYEAVKVIEAWKLGFNLGNTVKYIARAERKGAATQDLKKAAWYLQREIDNRVEAEEGKS